MTATSLTRYRVSKLSRPSTTRSMPSAALDGGRGDVLDRREPGSPDRSDRRVRAASAFGVDRGVPLAEEKLSGQVRIPTRSRSTTSVPTPARARSSAVTLPAAPQPAIRPSIDVPPPGPTSRRSRPARRRWRSDAPLMPVPRATTSMAASIDRPRLDRGRRGHRRPRDLEGREPAMVRLDRVRSSAAGASIRWVTKYHATVCWMLAVLLDHHPAGGGVERRRIDSSREFDDLPTPPMVWASSRIRSISAWSS